MGFLNPKQAEASNHEPTDERNPPPPYSSSSSLPQEQQQVQRSTTPSVPYGYPSQQQQQYPTQPPSTSLAPMPRTLHIYREGLTQKRGTVYDSDKTTPLYLLRNSWSADWSTSKPHIEILSPSTSQTIATVTFHAFSRTVDFIIHGHPLPMDSAGWFTRSYTFESPIGVLKWQATSVWGYSLQCITERGEWLARFDMACWSMKKEGRLEIVSRELPQQLVDQLVVTGLAMVGLEKRRSGGSGAGGGGA